LASVDTNVLVRALTDDDTSQTAKVRQLMHRADLRNERLYVPLTVTLELEWVLRSSYRYAKEHVLQAFSSLLEARELEFHHEHIVEDALRTYRRHPVDFAECLHLACVNAAARWPLFTFDRAAYKLPGVRAVA
jgi:predicted nucleic-acid-binding protein